MSDLTLQLRSGLILCLTASDARREITLFLLGSAGASEPAMVGKTTDQRPAVLQSEDLQNRWLLFIHEHCAVFLDNGAQALQIECWLDEHRELIESLDRVGLVTPE